jgi:hypothetical protein
VCTRVVVLHPHLKRGAAAHALMGHWYVCAMRGVCVHACACVCVCVCVSPLTACIATAHAGWMSKWAIGLRAIVGMLCDACVCARVWACVCVCVVLPGVTAHRLHHNTHAGCWISSGGCACVACIGACSVCVRVCVQHVCVWPCNHALAVTLSRRVCVRGACVPIAEQDMTLMNGRRVSQCVVNACVRVWGRGGMEEARAWRGGELR